MFSSVYPCLGPSLLPRRSEAVGFEKKQAAAKGGGVAKFS